jgi:hypothetical protein
MIDILCLSLLISSLINKCIYSYADSNVRREGPRIRKKLDKEIMHNEAMAKRVIGFMRMEWKEKAE